VAIAGTVLGILLLLFAVSTFALGPFFASQQPQGAPVPARMQPGGNVIWVFNPQSPALAARTTTGGGHIETQGGGLVFMFDGEGRANVTFGPDLVSSYTTAAFVTIGPNTDGTLIWRVRSVGDRSVAVRINASTEYVELIYEDLAAGTAELLGNPVPIRGLRQSKPTEVAVLVKTPAYTLYVDGVTVLETTNLGLDAAGSPQTISASGTRGTISLYELRIHETP
jgi:hypothetical protein